MEVLTVIVVLLGSVHRPCTGMDSWDQKHGYTSAVAQVVANVTAASGYVKEYRHAGVRAYPAHVTLDFSRKTEVDLAKMLTLAVQAAFLRKLENGSPGNSGGGAEEPENDWNFGKTMSVTVLEPSDLRARLREKQRTCAVDSSMKPGTAVKAVMLTKNVVDTLLEITVLAKGHKKVLKELEHRKAIKRVLCSAVDSNDAFIKELEILLTTNT